MDIVKKTVIFVVILVVGILIITAVLPPAVDEVLARPDVGSFTGLQQFLQLLPFLVVVALVVSGLLLLFRAAGRRDDGGDSHGLPRGYTRHPRLPWRR